jgi:outer membrane protein TolC
MRFPAGICSSIAMGLAWLAAVNAPGSLLLGQTPSIPPVVAGAVPPAGKADMARGSGELSLADYMQRVVEYNEAVQARVLAFHAARSQRRAEAGVFEPMWAATGEYVDRKRPNTVEIERSLRSGGFFRERNENYQSGLEMLSPLGTRVRLGVSGRQLINNLQRTVLVDIDAEYESQVGITLEQPLLKGAGTAVSLAGLRVAARTSEIAYQDYRRQLMQVLAEAEVGYWQLFYSQQELRLTGESVALAQTLVSDMRAALEAGRGSPLNVMEAEAGLAVRNARQSLARQKHAESLNRLLALCSGAPGTELRNFVATDAPRLQPVILSPGDALETAYAMSPEVLRAQALVAQEKIRVGYAGNQRLPQVDLKGSVGAQGLGYDWRTSWRDVDRRDFPTWTVALEVRVPLFGGVRGRNEFRASQQRLLQAERTQSDVFNQVRSGVDTAQQRMIESFRAAQTFASVVEFRTTLLDARLKGREVGRVESRAVLEAEQELLSARLDRLQSEIEYQRALLELELMSGTMLQNRGLELDFAALEKQTARWAEKGGGAMPALRYVAPVFDRWPAHAPVPFVGDSAPVFPWSGRIPFLREKK